MPIPRSSAVTRRSSRSTFGSTPTTWSPRTPAAPTSTPSSRSWSTGTSPTACWRAWRRAPRRVRCARAPWARPTAVSSARSEPAGGARTPLEAPRHPHAVRMVGQHFHHLSLGEPLLYGPPEWRGENLGVQAQQRLALRVVEGEETEEGLRKHIALAHVEPGLGAHLVLVALGPWQIAEVAVRHPA